MLHFALSHVRTCQSLALTTFAYFALFASASFAQPTGSFTLKISEKEMNLVHPGDPDWTHYIMWDLGFQRMTDRNMPFFELTNDASSTAPITDFRLTIGDTRFNFANNALGTYAMLAHSTPGFNLTSTTVGNLGNELAVHIGDGGLQPGALVRFKIDLGVDTAFADEFFTQPDFRTVLFDMNGLNIYDGNLQQLSAGDNAKASAIFHPATGANFTVGPTPIQDELVIGPEAAFYNDHYRRYRDMDPVRTFVLLGGVASVPEPTTVLLAVCGLAGVMCTARSRRRVRRSL